MKDYEEFLSETIENATDNIRTQLNRAYMYGHEQGKKVSCNYRKEDMEGEYNRGLNEAWEAAKKIAQMDTETSENVTGYFGLFRIMNNLTAAEAIEKVKAYEQKQNTEIKVGDEVTTIFGKKGVVITDVPCEDGTICVWFPNYTRVQMYPIKDLSKTGRTFPQIAEVLAEMRGEE